MSKFTVFCQDIDGTGTVWIDCVEAADIVAAQALALEACAADWGYGPTDDIAVLGVAEGDVKILVWNDLE